MARILIWKWVSIFVNNSDISSNTFLYCGAEMSTEVSMLAQACTLL